MQTIAPLWLWATFVGIVLVSRFVDFVVLKKNDAHDIGVKEALNWSLVWIALSCLFNGLFWWAVKDNSGSTEIANSKSLEFLTGGLIEKSPALDNIIDIYKIPVGVSLSVVVGILATTMWLSVRTSKNGEHA
jgi:tellurite resistance protein TerC